MSRIVPFPGMVLAGGLSRRMGRNKCLEMLGGKRLIDHAMERLRPQVSEIWINTGPATADDALNASGLPTIHDTIKGHAGPLAGVLAGLRHVMAYRPQSTRLLSVAADTPFFPDDLAARLADAVAGTNAVAVAESKGRQHPVFALWPIAVADDLEQWLADDTNRRLGAFLMRHPVIAVDFTPADMSDGKPDPFFNINTPDDLEQARHALATIQLRDNPD